MALIGRKNLGFLCLAIYLIVTGLTGLFTIPQSGLVTAFLALLAGVLLLVGR